MLKRLLPDDTFTTFYGRNEYTECGVVGFNEHLILVKSFLIYINHYLKDTIWNLKDNIDCHKFDNTRSLVKVKERNKIDGKDGHIIDFDKEINQYIDHKKGRRKYQPHSNEWITETRK